MTYDDIKKLSKNSLEYLSLICITNKKEIFNGDEIMLRIVKELENMQKSLDDLIYYDPKKFHEDEMKEIGFEEGAKQNKLDNAKECIKNNISKKLTLEITKITEEDYNRLFKEIKNESK